MIWFVLEMFAFAGLAGMTYGLWQIYPPAAWIFAGLVLLCGSFAIARKLNDVPTSSDKA